MNCPPATEHLDESTLRAKAWVGDAVLGLYARQWLSANGRALDATAFQHMTSNQFLATIGKPTVVEAKIGIVYETQGLAAAFDWLDQNLLPRFEKQESNRNR